MHQFKVSTIFNADISSIKKTLIITGYEIEVHLYGRKLLREICENHMNGYIRSSKYEHRFRAPYYG
uniref:Uncharacterized protein n=1 Tax=Parascaris equorum TaxID=6256 RepID=A0A914RJ30_PAREQ